MKQRIEGGMFDGITRLDDLRLISESSVVECKHARGRDGNGKLPDDFWPTYSAFANTHGGIVALGIREVERGRFELDGVVDSERIITDLFNTLNNKQKVSSNLVSECDVKKILCEGAQIVLVRIPAANRRQKPVYLNGNPFGNTYRRIHEGDRRCDEETVRRMLAEQVEDDRDSRILPGFGIDEIDSDSLQIYRQMLKDRSAAHPFLEHEGTAFLKQIGGWRRDRISGESGLTMAGLLMFGRWPAIQEAAPNLFLDYQEQSEVKSEFRWVDRIVPDGTWSGNVFDFFRRVYRKLTADLKVPFEIQDGQRRDDSPVHVALREALVNTLVHADFTGRVSVLIVKRPDLFGFRNPGGLRLPLEQILHGGESDCRNRLMHQMFLMIGLGERAGSGIPKIYSGWKTGHWRPPSLYEKDDPEQTLLELRMIDLLPKWVMPELRVRFGSAFEKLNTDEQLILATALTEQVVSHSRLIELCEIHSSDLTRLLQQLVRDGFLGAEGKSRGTVYYLRGETLPSPDHVFGVAPARTKLQTSGGLSTSSGGLGTSSGGLGTSSGGLGTSSGGLGTRSGGLPEQWVEDRAAHGRIHPDFDKPIIDNLEGLDEALRAQLQKVAYSVSSQRKCGKNLVKDVVLQLCKDRFLTLAVLGDLLSRSDEYLRKEILNPLVAEKLLERAFPSRPNDPRQAYTTSLSSKTKQK